MTNNELIAKAKEHLNVFERSNPDPSPVSVCDLPETRVQETVVIYFESNQRAEKIRVYLDKNSGDFIEAQYVPAK